MYTTILVSEWQIGFMCGTCAAVLAAVIGLGIILSRWRR
jgi:hypothetical protein